MQVPVALVITFVAVVHEKILSPRSWQEAPLYLFVVESSANAISTPSLIISPGSVPDAPPQVEPEQAA